MHTTTGETTPTPTQTHQPLPFPVSTTITGVKPLINFVVVAIFSLRLHAHLKMLRQLDSVDRSFWSAYNRTPNVRLFVTLFFTSLLMAFLIPLTYRIYESSQLTDQLQGQPLKEKSASDWLTDYTFIVVPL